MDPVLPLTDAPSPEARGPLDAGLDAFDAGRGAAPDRVPLAVLVHDPATGRVLGGLWGRTEWGLPPIGSLVLPELLRGRGMGGRLLGVAEAEARRRGCTWVSVETQTWQAPGFYARHGYEEFGRVPLGVPGQTRLYLRKRLA